MLSGEIHNSKDGMYPVTFHKQPITCVVTAELEELQPNHVVSMGPAGRAEQAGLRPSSYCRLTDCVHV